jgi:predicted  nucleic acid-binding Zn-ribbon protein
MGDWTALNNGEQLQLCDANGRIVGVFLTPAALEQMNVERERLAKEVEELRKQLDEGQRQIALLEEDWHSMFRLLPKELQVTEEDIREIQRDPHTFEEILEMFEQHKPS